jgi:hypothetical protein
VKAPVTGWEGEAKLSVDLEVSFSTKKQTAARAVPASSAKDPATTCPENRVLAPEQAELSAALLHLQACTFVAESGRGTVQAKRTQVRHPVSTAVQVSIGGLGMSSSPRSTGDALRRPIADISRSCDLEVKGSRVVAGYHQVHPSCAQLGLVQNRWFFSWTSDQDAPSLGVASRLTRLRGQCCDRNTIDQCSALRCIDNQRVYPLDQFLDLKRFLNNIILQHR